MNFAPAPCTDPGPTKGQPGPQTGSPDPKRVGGKVQENRRSLSADSLRRNYFGGVLESAGGGVVVPLLDESGGGLAGADWSAGGALCIEFEELESGAAGAVVA